eukprot:XP_020393784.1 mucin-2-like [Zea mays]
MSSPPSPRGPAPIPALFPVAFLPCSALHAIPHFPVGDRALSHPAASTSPPLSVPLAPGSDSKLPHRVHRMSLTPARVFFPPRTSSSRPARLPPACRPCRTAPMPFPPAVHAILHHRRHCRPPSKPFPTSLPETVPFPIRQRASTFPPLSVPLAPGSGSMLPHRVHRPSLTPARVFLPPRASSPRESRPARRPHRTVIPPAPGTPAPANSVTDPAHTKPCPCARPRRHLHGRLELTLATRTVVDPFHLPIQFPPYPKHLMPFHEVLQQPHKRFIDVIGIVIHLAPLERIGGRPYREAILMDSRWDIIVVGIWPELLQRNALRWVLARENKSIIIGTMLRRNKLHRCLQTSDHNIVEFDPDHHTTQRNSALHDKKSEECFNQQLSREETGLSGNSGSGCVV